MQRTIAIALTLALAAGCGKVKLPGGGEGPDTDAGPPDATAIGPVTVTVLSFDGLRTPVEGMDVGFFAPDGSHDATVATDADGVASSDLESGGAIVVFQTPPPALGGGGSAVAYAVLAVEPGDHIVVGGDPFLGGEAPVMMTVTLPAVTGAIVYEVDTSCGNFSNGTRVVTLSFAAGCDPDTFSFLATASGDAGRVYLREEDAPVIGGGNYDAMGSWQMMPTRPFLFTGIPPEADNLNVGVFAVRAGEDQLNVSLGRDGATVSEEMITLRPERVPGYDETLVWTEVRPDQQALGAFDIVRWLGPDEDTDLDLGAAMLPWMSPVTYQSATRSLDWHLIGDQDHDATYLTLIAGINGETFLETTWFIMAPPGIEQIVLPTLPAAKSGYFLPDPEFVNAYGQIVESSQVDGYDGARAVGFDLSYFPRQEPLGSVVRTTFSGVTLR
jgi:hypothetical protein